MAAHTTPSGNGEELTPQQTYPGVKVGAGQKNSWRFMLKDNLGTVYGNGQRLFEFRLVGQEVLPEVHFYAQSDDESDGLWRFSNVKLATPPRNEPPPALAAHEAPPFGLAYRRSAARPTAQKLLLLAPERAIPEAFLFHADELIE